MKSAISAFLIVLSLGSTGLSTAEEALPRVLRQQIVANGFIAAKDLYVKRDESLIDVGKVIFKSKKLSLNGNIACQTCHLAKFGSGDGIPVAAAIRGTGEGPERLLSGAKLLPRNTLPFWVEEPEGSIRSFGTER